MCIYQVTCLVTRKSYVGQTVRSLKERWAEHVRDSRKLNYAFYRAIRKYGADQFSISVLQKCLSVDELNEAEPLWIYKYNTLLPDGYNTTSGGNSFKFSQEAKTAMSARSKGRPKSDQAKARMKATAQLPAVKVQKHETGKLLWANPEYVASQKQALAKAMSTEEYREKQRAILKARWQDPDFRRKQSELRKQNWGSEAYRKKVEDGLRKRGINATLT